MTRRCRVFRLATKSPADVDGLLALLASGELDARDIRAIFGKTEGNGCVNDFSRAFTVSALRSAVAGPLGCTPAEVGARVAMVMSGGTEGGLSPHMLVFAVDSADAAPTKGLAIGTAFTRKFRAEDIGRMPQIEATATAVTEAMLAADIADPADIHYVQVKCPLLTGNVIASCGNAVTNDTNKSMGFSRGASALGVALALGEVARDVITDDVVCRRLDLMSGRASASSGIELPHSEIVVLGNSDRWSGDFLIGHRVMRDAIDAAAVVRVLRDVGLSGALDDAGRERVVAVLAKADPSTTGRIRGLRHVMLDDSDIQATRHVRALVGGVIAGVIGRTDLFVSGGAEHQGPDGGGPIAIIARRDAETVFGR